MHKFVFHQLRHHLLPEITSYLILELKIWSNFHHMFLRIYGRCLTHWIITSHHYIEVGTPRAMGIAPEDQLKLRAKYAMLIRVERHIYVIVLWFWFFFNLIYHTYSSSNIQFCHLIPSFRMSSKGLFYIIGIFQQFK